MGELREGKRGSELCNRGKWRREREKKEEGK